MFPPHPKAIVLFLCLHAGYAAVGAWLLWYNRWLLAPVASNALFLTYYSVPFVAGVAGVWRARRGKPSRVLLWLASAYSLFLAGGEAFEHGRVLAAYPLLALMELQGLICILFLIAELVWISRVIPARARGAGSQRASDPDR